MRYTFILLFICQFGFAQDKLPIEEIDARLRQIYGIARETNDRKLVNELLTDRDGVYRAIKRQDAVLIERLLRDMEKKVGLDHGGKSMHGLPISRLTFQEQKKLNEHLRTLNQAMAKDDLAQAQKTVDVIQQFLGDQTGVPDARRAGDDAKPIPMKPADLAELFAKIVDVEAIKLKRYVPGKPLEFVMPRDYASIIQGCVAMRPLIAQHQPKTLELLDSIIIGACQGLIAIQAPDGFFKFPDLRGKHIRFGEMIEQIVEQSATNVQDGYVTIPAPDGGSQFDAGEAGIALLRAGQMLKKDEFIDAGLKAANWTLTIPPVANFNYNAFSVSLLCEAYRVRPEGQYLEAAWKKWSLGVGLGQAPNGRWIDPHNARTVYHFIIMRAGCDLLAVTKPNAQTAVLKKQMQHATKTILDEAEKLGPPNTTLTLQVLTRVAELADVTDSRLKPATERAAMVALLKCSKNGVRAGVALPEFAAITRVWSK